MYNYWFIIRILILIMFLTYVLPLKKMNPVFYTKFTKTTTINKNIR